MYMYFVGMAVGYAQVGMEETFHTEIQLGWKGTRLYLYTMFVYVQFMFGCIRMGRQLFLRT